MTVHPTAIVDPRAEIAAGVEVGPHATIEGEVRLGAGTRVGAGAHLAGPLEVGEECQIFSGAVVGFPPQDRSWKGESAGTVLGNRAVVREYATIHRATGTDHPTTVGEDLYIMAYGHIGHDCIVGQGVTIASTCFLSGHVQVEDRATFSGGVYIHQYCRVGTLAMLGALTASNQDIPPYVIAVGRPAQVAGLNRVGLKRGGLTVEERNALKEAYRRLFRSDEPRAAACQALLEADPPPAVAHLARFILDSTRGVASAPDQKKRAHPGLAVEGDSGGE